VTNLNPDIGIVKLNVNYLNTPIKRQRLAGYIKKYESTKGCYNTLTLKGESKRSRKVTQILIKEKQK
jgi:hypothetical protein